MQKSFKIKSAFSLVEAIVAVAVLLTAFVGAARVFPEVIRYNASVKDTTIASHLAADKLEEYIYKDYTNIPINLNPQATNFTESGFEKFSWKAKVSQESTDLKKIELTVVWGTANVYQTSLVTYKAK